MNEYHLGTVEEELQRVEDDFHSGRMNAFGNQSTHERMEKELRKIRELDEWIFAKVCNCLERDEMAEWHFRRDVEPVPVASSEAPSAARQEMGGANQPASSTGAAAASATTSNTATVYGMRCVSDAAFESAASYFTNLDKEFVDIGESLRKMSNHVVALNQLADVSHQVAASSGGASVGVNVRKQQR